MNKTETSDITSEFILPDIKFRLTYVTLSSLTIFFSFISFLVMMQAPRINSNIKYLCNNILCYDIMTSLCVIINNSVIYNRGLLLYRLQNLCILGGVVAVAGFSVERCIALSAPLKYRRYFKKAYIKIFVWTLLFCLSVTCFLLSAVSASGLEIKPPRISCWIIIGLRLSLNVISLICNLKSISILKKHLSQINVLNNTFTNQINPLNIKDGLVSTMCMLYCVIYLPFDIELLIRKCDLPLERLYSFNLVILNIVINPIVYIWRFRECRLQGLIYLSKFPGLHRLKETVNRRQNAIFNITTINRGR